MVAGSSGLRFSNKISTPGKIIVHVGALSCNLGVEEINVIDVTEADWVKVAQMQDEGISRIKQILEKKEQCANSKQYFKEYLLREGKVYKSCKMEEQLG